MPKGRRNPGSAGKPIKAVTAYSAHKQNARHRGIPFLFTFQEWWDWWQVDDRWSNRGVHLGQYVMARIGDVGSYEAGNVYCATTTENYKEVPSAVRRAAAYKRWRTTGLHRTEPLTRRPPGRSVITPFGVFHSVSLASESLNISPQGLRFRLDKRHEGYGYGERKPHVPAPEQVAAVLARRNRARLRRALSLFQRSGDLEFDLDPLEHGLGLAPVRPARPYSPRERGPLTLNLFFGEEP